MNVTSYKFKVPHTPKSQNKHSLGVLHLHYRETQFLSISNSKSSVNLTLTEGQELQSESERMVSIISTYISYKRIS